MARVVYLDDEEELAEVFGLLLAQTEHSVQTFTEEIDAIGFCKASPPDILFVDFRLAHMSGDDVANMLPDSIKKVLVTGDIKIESEFKFDAIIHKPFKLAEILSIIESLCSHQ